MSVLRVLVNAGPWLPVPPAGYGGIETVVATLVPELRRAGAHVTLATVGPSTLEADDFVRPLAEPAFRSIAMPYNRVSGIAHAHMQGLVDALRDRGRWDVVHDHLEVVGPSVLGAMGAAAPPTLQTLHWDLRKHPEFYSGFDGRGRVRFAAVSASQLDRAPANLRRQTLGVVPLAAPPPLEVEVTETTVSFSRDYPPAPIAAWHAELLGLSTDAEHAQRESGAFVTPGLWVDRWEVQTESDGDQPVTFIFSHAVTPISADRTRHVWRVSRNFARGDQASKILMAIFTTSGTFMLLFIAALQSIAPEIHEAAVMDRTNAWQRFWHVTLPMQPTMQSSP